MNILCKVTIFSRTITILPYILISSLKLVKSCICNNLKKGIEDNVSICNSVNGNCRYLYISL